MLTTSRAHVWRTCAHGTVERAAVRTSKILLSDLRRIARNQVVNETVAAMLSHPVVGAADVDSWTERARAMARVAVAEAAGCTRDYRRLAGSGLSGDERLYRAMHARHERQLEHLQRTMAAVSENVVRYYE